MRGQNIKIIIESHLAISMTFVDYNQLYYSIYLDCNEAYLSKNIAPSLNERRFLKGSQESKLVTNLDPFMNKIGYLPIDPMNDMRFK